MSARQHSEARDRCRDALADLQATIAARYPDARFRIVEGDDPPGVYLRPEVSDENFFDVLDLVGDKLYHYQVEQHLPVYVFPTRPAGTRFEPVSQPH